MSYGREKRLLLGWLALLLPLPLPLNDALEWPVLFVYTFLVVHFLRRVENGQQEWLPNWALNLLGLLYLPILAIDFQRAFVRDQAVNALLHLILFVLLAKLYSMRREKDKWHIFLSLFFVFVAAMATSSHLTIAFYLLAALAGGFVVMTRFAHFHVLARVERGLALDRENPARTPARAPTIPSLRGPVALALLLVVVLAVPIFAVMPRIRQPFIMGQGSGNISLSRTTGFSDQVDLSLTSEIRSSTSVALRLELDATSGADGSSDGGLDGAFDAENFRFKGASYDFYRDRRWHRHPLEGREMFADAEGLMHLPGAPPGGQRATLYLEPLGSRSLVLPSQTVAIDVARQVSSLRLDAGGAVILPGPAPRQTAIFDVVLGEKPYITALREGDPQLQLEALDTSGISPRMAELAAQVAGEGTPEEKADRLLSHLLNNYFYTLDFVGRDGKAPLDDFLFVYKSGHCEYFASAMVLMLRSQGIPARLVTGFLGAERNALEGYFVVRQRNAHAWVEAFTPKRGWSIYDPTPPDGRPSAAVRDWRLLLQQIYDYAAFRWDRYVLTYGAEDQSDFLAEIRRRLEDLWQRAQGLFDDAEPDVQSPDLPVTDASPSGLGAEPGGDGAAFWQSRWARFAGLGLLIAALSAWLLLSTRRPLTPGEAYDRLRRGLADHGLQVALSTPPLALRRQLRDQHPHAAAEAEKVIDLYVRESFAQTPATLDDRRLLRHAVVSALSSVGRDLKAERKAQKKARADRKLKVA